MNDTRTLEERVAALEALLSRTTEVVEELDHSHGGYVRLSTEP